MNKKYIMFVIAFIFLIMIANINAADFKTSFTANAGTYGTIDVNKCEGVFSGVLCSIGLSDGTKISSYTLDRIEESLINIKAFGTSTLYEDGQKLFSDTTFKDRLGNVKSITEVKYYILQNKSYTVDLPVYNKCPKENMSCELKITSYETETRYNETWIEYDLLTKLPSGTYKWKMEGKRRINQRIDWIPIIDNSVSLDKWIWFDAQWNYKRAIYVTIPENNYTVKVIVNKTININAGFTDIRFTASDDLTELYYWIENFTETNATVWVMIPSNQTIFMYYGNAIANTTSNIKAAFITGDDFNDGSIDTNIWNSSQASEANGNLSIVGGGSIGYAYTQTSRVTNISIRARVMENVTTYGELLAAGSNLGAWGATRSGWDTDGSGLILEKSTLGSAVHMAPKRYYIFSINFVSASVGNGTTQENGTSGTTGNSDFLYNGTINSAFSTLNDWGFQAFDATQKVSVDWAYVRKYDYPDPVVSLWGNELLAEALLVYLESPVNEYNITASSIELKCNSSYGTLGVLNLSLYINNALTYVVNNSSAGQNLTITYTKTGLTDGKYNWTCEAIGAEMNNQTTAARYFTRDTTAPTLSAPYNLTTNVSIGSFPYINPWNYTVSDSGVGVDKCWWRHYSPMDLAAPEAVGTIVECNAKMLNLTITSTTELGKTKVKYCSNDTLNNLRCNVYNLTVFYYNVTHNASKTSVGEGDSATFYLTINRTTNTNVDAVFTFNTTTYAPDSENEYGNLTIFSKTLTFPVGTGNNTGKFNYFNWTYNITGYLSNNVTSTKNISIIAFNISDCDTVSGDRAFNFTLFDEETKAIIDGTTGTNVEIELNISSRINTSITWSFIKQYTNISNISICVPTGLLNGTNYRFDLITKYDSTNRVKEFYFVDNGTLYSSTIPYNIFMYDLLNSSSTEFLVTYKDNSYLPVENALILIRRKYVGEGVYRTVEVAKTDNSGQAKVHLDKDGVIYAITVTKDGKLLSTYNNLAVTCSDILIGECKINLNAESSNERFTDYEEYQNLRYGLSFNQTLRRVSLSYLTTDGLIATVLLNVSKFDSYNNLTVCTNSQTASSGSFNCDINDNYGNISIYACVYKDGALVACEEYNLDYSGKSTFGIEGLAMVLILMITIPFMFFGSLIGIIIGIIIGLIIVSLLSLFNGGSILGTTSSIIWIIIAGGIIIWKISKNKGVYAQ